jgi:hypothetical protein
MILNLSFSVWGLKTRAAEETQWPRTVRVLGQEEDRSQK